MDELIYADEVSGLLSQVSVERRDAQDVWVALDGIMRDAGIGYDAVEDGFEAPHIEHWSQGYDALRQVRESLDAVDDDFKALYADGFAVIDTQMSAFGIDY